MLEFPAESGRKVLVLCSLSVEHKTRMVSTGKVTVWPLPERIHFYLILSLVLISFMRSGRAGPSFLTAERMQRPPKGDAPFVNPLRPICFFGKAGLYPYPATSYGRSGGRLFSSSGRSVSPRSAPRSRCQKSEVRFQNFSPKVGAKFWFCALFRRSTDPIHGILWQSNIFVPLPIPKSDADNL